MKTEMLASWNIPLDKVHLVLRDNAANILKAMRDSALPSFGCFAHSLQLVVHDGVFAQRAVLDLYWLYVKRLSDILSIQPRPILD